MKLFSILVTGANRGIGLEFVKQFVKLPEAPEYVFATYRNRNGVENLKAIRDSPDTKSKVMLLKMDVNVEEEIKTSKNIIEDMVGEKGLTLLINNAGVALPMPFGEISAENMIAHFTVNTVGPVMVLQNMLPLLKSAAAHVGGTGMSFTKAAVLNISSLAGSIGGTGKILVQDLAVMSYKISKAALNMATKAASEKMKDDNILIISMCPGWVKTDMGGKDHAKLTPEESISAMLKTISTLNETNTGSYMDRLGNPYPF